MEIEETFCERTTDVRTNVCTHGHLSRAVELGFLKPTFLFF